MKTHLTEEQIDDHLIGGLDGEAAAHLAVCPACSGRVALAAAPIAEFSAVAQAWSERRSATLPHYAPLAVSQPVYRQFAAAAAALALLSVTLGTHLLRNQAHDAGQHAATQSAAAAGVAAQPLVQLASSGPTDVMPARERSLSDRISRDNQMLQAVDTALDPAAEGPASLVLDTPSSGPVRPPSLQD
jgi:hypothetical protein